MGLLSHTTYYFPQETSIKKLFFCSYFIFSFQFECDPTSVMDAIIQVDEPQSCQYVITVLTSKICAIPHLRPPPVHKPVKIECRPLLTSIEYEKYQNYLKV